MEKSSLNIKSFRNLLSNQGKSYKIPPDNYQPTEVKYINGPLIDNAAAAGNCSIEDIYSIKRHKATASGSDNGCDRKRIRDAVCGNLRRFFRHHSNSNFCLPLFTPIFSSICVIIVIAALFGTSWISTEERIPWLQVNSSFQRYNNFTLSYVIKSSNASLWIMCTRLALDDNRTKADFPYKNCTRIDYFDTEKYQPDPRDSTNESTNVIPYTITLSAPVLIVSFIILLISYLLFLLAICSQKYKIFYFIAGIGFIISGLLMLSGLIMFISIFKSEVFHKLRPSGQEPPFTFSYGHSFILYVIGFIVVELAGILNVCLFSRLQKAEELNQSHLLNNYVKPAKATSGGGHHHTHIAFAANIDNGYIPHKSGTHCSLHTTAAAANVKLTNNMNGGSNHIRSHMQRPMLPTRFDAFNHVPFTRNASTSTLDLDNEADGDSVSLRSNHRMMRDKAGGGNKLDFNNICGMMRSTGKSKECSAGVYHRAMKPARNIYYIKDQADEDEPNIFIVDPRFYKNRKCALQKSLEDIRMQKMNNNSYAGHHHHDTISCGSGGGAMDRSYYGSKTLPRDFCRPKHGARPSLSNFLDNFHQDGNRLNPLSHNHSHHNLHSHYHHPQATDGYGGYHHHGSCDELLASKLYRNMSSSTSFYPASCAGSQAQRQEYQWPKVIPKSPSSYSMNSFRINRQSSYGDRSSTTYNPIEEFDLDKIEHERRKSHTNLFKEGRQQQQHDELKKEFGTAV